MQKYYREATTLITLAIPVVIAQVSQTAMGFVDTIMAGAVSSTDMSAVAVGVSIWLPAILFAQGILFALTPIIAQFNGSGRRDLVAHQVRQGVWVAILLSFFVMLVLYNSRYFILLNPQIDTQLAEKSINYLHAMMWGVPGYLLYQTLRNQCEGLSKTKPAMIIAFLCLLLNIPLNYIFIYGKLGMPALGGVGCGVATAIVYWIMFMMMRRYIQRSRSLRDITSQQKFERPIWPTIKLLFNLGLPISLAIFFEVSLFAIVALLVAPLGVNSVAGHQIALNFSALMFVLPLSFGVAASIRVGHCLGEKSTQAAKIAAYVSLAVGFLIAVCTALATYFLRGAIASLYTSDTLVIEMAMHLLLFAAIYQCSDAIQVVISGILRGYKDTKAIFLITLIAYWGLGFPIGYLLALTDYGIPAMGPSGFWIGFIVGLTAAAIMLVLRMRWIQKQPIAQIIAKAEHR